MFRRNNGCLPLSKIIPYVFQLKPRIKIILHHYVNHRTVTMCFIIKRGERPAAAYVCAYATVYLCKRVRAGV